MAKQQSSPSALWSAVIVLALLGLALSIHLTYLHANIYINPNYKSICAISAKINCESVALSKYAILFGIPVAVWGLLAYLGFLVVGFLGMRQPATDPKAAFHGALFLMGLAGTAGSAYFAYVSHYKIGALCPSCMGTYIVNPLLFLISIALLRRDQHSPGDAVNGFFNWIGNNGQIVFILVFLLGIGLFAFPRYWKGAEPWQDRDIPSGSDHGHAWLGAKQPRITIVEYTDYQCPHCQVQHNQLRKILRKHKDVLRVVHRHYPLDHNCHPKIKQRFHPNACLFARAAFCAGEQHKFWPMNDILYRDGKTLEKPGLLTAAKTIGLKTDKFKQCIDSDRATDAVSQDLRDGMKSGVRGTPYFFVNGKAFDSGEIPSKYLEELLEAAHAGKLPIQHTRKHQHTTRKHSHTRKHQHTTRRITHRPASPRIAPRPVAAPRIASPRIVAPRIVAPRIVAPRIVAPRIAAPRIVAPRIAAPRIVAPRIAAPRIAAPRIAAPRIVVPPTTPRSAASQPATTRPAPAR